MVIDDISDDDDNDDDDNDSYSGDLYESSGNVKPVWDQADGVFRCKECAFEVVDGVCHACGTEFKWLGDVSRYFLAYKLTICVTIGRGMETPTSGLHPFGHAQQR